jgi:predicted HicB family RNase H-like nuclease
MIINVKQDYPKQIGNVRVSEEIYDEIKKIAERNDVSIQAIVRAVLEEAVYSGLVVKGEKLK